MRRLKLQSPANSDGDTSINKAAMNDTDDHSWDLPERDADNSPASAAALGENSRNGKRGIGGLGYRNI
jgi:hypothetical protein